MPLRKSSGDEDGAILPTSTSGAHQENNILTALQRGLVAGEVVGTVYGLLVDFEDDVASVQSDIFGERTGLYVLHDHAFPCGYVEAIGDFWSQGANRYPEFAFFGFLRVAIFFVFAQSGSEEFGAVGDGDGGVLFLTAANERQLGLAAGLAVGNVGDQVVAIFDFAAVNGGDGVTHFEANLISRAASD